MGTTLRVDGRQREIIGVLPSAFALPGRAPVIFMRFQWDRNELQVGNFSYQAIARLSAGATIDQANADLTRMIPMALEKFPGGLSLGMLEEARFGPLVRPLMQDYVGDVGNVLWVLLGTVGIVLLIACANVANLFLVRAEGRGQEVAVRTAMGAPRGEIARQFLLESIVLGVLGGLVGLALAFAGIRLLVQLGPESLPRLTEVSMDPMVLVFTLGVSLLSGLLFGLFPVFRMRGLDLVASLKEGGRGGSAGKASHRARNTLVVAQMALALVLLAGSGLMIRSFQALRGVDPGFANPEEVLTFRVALPRAEIPEDAEAALAYEEMWRRLTEIPSVTSVGITFSLTMDGYDSSDALWVEDIPVVPDQIPPIRRYQWVSGDYFETVQNPVLAGRPIEWSDVHDRAPIGVVTENLAVEYWGSADPLT